MRTVADARSALRVRPDGDAIVRLDRDLHHPDDAALQGDHGLDLSQLMFDVGLDSAVGLTGTVCASRRRRRRPGR